MTKKQKIEQLLINSKQFERFSTITKQVLEAMGNGYKEYPKTYKYAISLFLVAIKEEQYYENIMLDLFNLYDELFTEQEIDYMLEYSSHPLFNSVLEKQSEISKRLTNAPEKLVVPFTNKLEEHDEALTALLMEDHMDQDIDTEN